MKYLIFSHWGLGDLVLICPSVNSFYKFIKKVNNQNTVSIIVKGEVEKQIAKELLNEKIEIISLNNNIANKKIYRFIILLFNFIRLKLYTFDYILIPPFFTNRFYLYLKTLSFFFKFKILFEKIEGHRKDVFKEYLEKVFDFKIFLKKEINLIRKKHFVESYRNKKILIFPGSDPSQFWKRYSIDKFIQLGYLLKKKNFKFSFLIGPGEINLINKIPFHIKISKNFNDLKKIFSDTKILISSDTGIAHLASLMSNISIISINGPTNYKLTKPSFSKVKIIKSNLKLNCMPCINTKLWGNCDKNFKCLANISPNVIMSEINKNEKNYKN